MALRRKDITKILSTIFLSVGSFWLVSDVQNAVNSAIGFTASIVLGVVVLLVAGFLFNLD